jgi:hypothetical protein
MKTELETQDLEGIASTERTGRAEYVTPMKAHDRRPNVTRRSMPKDVYTHAGSVSLTGQGDYPSSGVCKRPGCLKRFSPVKKWQRFCSPGCHDLYWKELRRRASEMDRIGSEAVSENKKVHIRK